MCLRIQRSRATVKDLHSRRQHAYRRDDVRLARRPTILIALLVHHVPVAVLCARWGLSPAGIYGWQQALLLRGLDSLVYGQSGGCQPKLSPKQQPRFVALLEAGPLVVGCETACGASVRIRVLIGRELGVLSNCQYVCTLLHHVGCALHKARLVSDHLDAARRQPWLQQAWPRMLRAAQRHKGPMLFADEASFAQWGALRSPWARRGQQPEVKPSGKRKGSKVLGARALFSGRLCLQGIEGRFHAASARGFLQMRMAQTTPPLLLIHDGARSHTRAATQAFLAAHRDRITVEPLPSYAPDDKPLAYLWKKTKKRATHHQYCKEFAALTVSVDKALAYFVTPPDTVLGLFGPYGEESGLVLKQAA